MTGRQQKTYYEFFAGGGMARAGLGAEWKCLFANDFDAKKVDAYAANWGRGEIKYGDIYDLEPTDLPGAPDLAWGSFPCQDLSLAGNGAGLSGTRSEAFWGFWQVVDALRQEKRAPKLLVLENVVGALTSNGGKDFREICRALHLLDYVFGALVMDAVHFLPQSRPRLFIVAMRKGLPYFEDFAGGGPEAIWTNATLQRAVGGLPADLLRAWRWWRVSAPARSNVRLDELIEDEPADAPWHSAAETAKFLAMMSSSNREKVARARKSGKRVVGAIYRRTRHDENGSKIQRAEVRFDGIAGCLRTPGGGSSRQFIMVVEGETVRTRLLSGREAARLMGLPDDYKLPANYNDAYHLMGDGLAIPVVRHLAQFLLCLLQKEQADTMAA
jgi:DNA (cytosine-5)-methyltransferase 1